MKKFLALVLAITTLLSCSAFAAPQDELQEIMDNTNKITDVSAIVDFNFKLNKEIPKELTGNVDIKSILDAFKYSLKMDAQTEGNTKLLSAMNLDMSIPMAKSINMDMYIDMDLSDKENPKFMLITKVPELDKYMVVDYIKIPGFMDTFQDALNEKTDAKLEKELFDGINFSDVKIEANNGVYKIVISKEIASKFMNNYIKLLSEMTEGMLKGVGEDMSAVSEFYNSLKDFNFFKDDAVVVELKANDKKVMESMNVAVNLDFNAFDLAQKMGDEISKGLENVKREDTQVDFTLSIDFKFDYDKKIDIKLPEITPENSIDALAAAGGIGTDEDEIIVLVNEKMVEFDVKPLMENDRTLVPLRALCNAIGVEDIEYNEETQEIAIKNSETTINLTVDNDVAIVNGEEIKLDAPAKVVDGRTLVPLRFVSETFKLDVNFTEVNKGGIIEIIKK